MSSRSLRSTLPSEVKGAAWATVAIMLSMLTVATLDSRYHGSLHCVLVHEVLQAPLQAALGDDDEPAHVFLDERNVAIHGMTIGAPAWASSSSLRRSRGAQALERIELLGAPFAGQPDDDGDGDNELGDTLGHSSGQPASLLGSAARVPVDLVWIQRGHAVVLSMSSCGAIRAGNGGGTDIYPCPSPAKVDDCPKLPAPTLPQLQLQQLQQVVGGAYGGADDDDTGHRRLFIDYLDSGSCTLSAIEVSCDNYLKAARDKYPSWDDIQNDWKLDIEGLIELSVEYHKVETEGGVAVAWRGGLLSSQELSDEVADMYGDSPGIVIIWLQVYSNAASHPPSKRVCAKHVLCIAHTLHLSPVKQQCI